MNAYELGVKLALDEAGLTKEAIFGSLLTRGLGRGLGKLLGGAAKKGVGQGMPFSGVRAAQGLGKVKPRGFLQRLGDRAGRALPKTTRGRVMLGSGLGAGAGTGTYFGMR